MVLQRLSGNRLRLGLWLLALTLLMLSGGVLLAQEEGAADTPWSVYLYSYSELQIQQFNADGSVVTHQLEPGSENGLSSAAAFSPDETHLAYCLPPQYSEDPDAAPPPPVHTLVMRDLAAGNNRFEVPLGEMSACNLTSESFSLDGSRVAVGAIPPFPEEGVDPSESGPAWTLYVLDTATGEILHTLDALNPQLSDLGIDTAQFFMMPYVRRVEGDLVYFALVNWFTEGMPMYDAFAWDTSANTVTEAPIWGRPFADEIITADGLEFAYTMLDENQPAANPGGPMPEANVVVVQRQGGEPVVVYTNTEEIISSVRYINDGTALAIGLLGAFEMAGDIPADQPLRYVMLSRDGTLTDLTEPVVNSSVDVRAVPGGYIHFVSSYDPATNSMSGSLDAVTDGQTTTLWTDEPGSQGWNLIYATQPDLRGVSLPEFTPAS